MESTDEERSVWWVLLLSDLICVWSSSSSIRYRASWSSKNSLWWRNRLLAVKRPRFVSWRPSWSMRRHRLNAWRWDGTAHNIQMLYKQEVDLFFQIEGNNLNSLCRVSCIVSCLTKKCICRGVETLCFIKSTSDILSRFQGPLRKLDYRMLITVCIHNVHGMPLKSASRYLYKA